MFTAYVQYDNSCYIEFQRKCFLFKFLINLESLTNVLDFLFSNYRLKKNNCLFRFWHHFFQIMIWKCFYNPRFIGFNLTISGTLSYLDSILTDLFNNYYLIHIHKISSKLVSLSWTGSLNSLLVKNIPDLNPCLLSRTKMFFPCSVVHEYNDCLIKLLWNALLDT